MKRTKKSERFRKDELVIGRRPVLEALRCGNLERIYLAAGQKGEIIDQIIRGAGQLAVPLQIVERRDLSRMAGSGKHQGAVALAAPFRYLGLGELMERAKAERGDPFLIMLDHLQDPQNLGSLLRTAGAAGMQGLIVPEDRSVGITPVVRKVAAGAAERLPVARVVNLVHAAQQLKDEGFWIYGAGPEGELPYYRVDYSSPFVLVIGSEGKGLSRLLRGSCDGAISIPMPGGGGSLNAAVAAALIIYEAAAQREGWSRLLPGK